MHTHGSASMAYTGHVNVDEREQALGKAGAAELLSKARSQ